MTIILLIMTYYYNVYILQYMGIMHVILISTVWYLRMFGIIFIVILE